MNNYLYNDWNIVTIFFNAKPLIRCPKIKVAKPNVVNKQPLGEKEREEVEHSIFCMYYPLFMCVQTVITVHKSQYMKDKFYAKLAPSMIHSSIWQAFDNRTYLSQYEDLLLVCLCAWHNDFAIVLKIDPFYAFQLDFSPLSLSLSGTQCFNTYPHTMCVYDDSYLVYCPGKNEIENHSHQTNRLFYFSEK